MAGVIYCYLSNQKVHEFYLSVSGNTYYLFSQKYRKSVHKYYRDGVHLKDAIDFSKSHRDNAIVHTMQKLPMYIRYAEKENGIAILNKTKMRSSKDRKYQTLVSQST